LVLPLMNCLSLFRNSILVFYVDDFMVLPWRGCHWCVAVVVPESFREFSVPCSGLGNSLIPWLLFPFDSGASYLCYPLQSRTCLPVRPFLFRAHSYSYVRGCASPPAIPLFFLGNASQCQNPVRFIWVSFIFVRGLFPLQDRPPPPPMSEIDSIEGTFSRILSLFPPPSFFIPSLPFFCCHWLC